MTNALEKDSISAFSQGHVSFRADEVPCTTPPASYIREEADVFSKHFNDGSKDVLWLVCQPTCERQAGRSFNSPGVRNTESNRDEDTANKQLGICPSTAPPAPPMTCAIAVSLGKLKTCKRVAPNEKRHFFRRNSVRRLVHHAPARARCKTVSDTVSISEGTGRHAGEEGDRVTGNFGNQFVLVAEACRFIFALSLTLDLLLGLLPFLGAIVLAYLLPNKGSIDNQSAALSVSFMGACEHREWTAVALPVGYLLSLQTSAATVCTLRELALWSLALALLVSSVHALILFSQAARIFFPLNGRNHATQLMVEA